jgi:CheY-like chemotaxis protein/predicted RNA-binding Zn-ribbon protein involved in translation (DUF1610 family)
LGHPLLTILTSANTVVFRQLGAPAFRTHGGELNHIVGQTGADLMRLATEQRPALIIIDAELPDGSGLAVCRQIKEDPALTTIPVIVVMGGVLSGDSVRDLLTCRCDDVFHVPSPVGELYLHVAQLLGMPIRGRPRLHVDLVAEVESSDGAKVPSVVVDFSSDGAKLAVPEALEPGAMVRLKLKRDQAPDVLTVDGCVAWSVKSPIGVTNVGIDFRTAATPAQRARIAQLGLWDIAVAHDVTRVTLHGDFDEGTSFADLAGRLTGVVEFDLRAVRHINSAGVHRWVQFLRQIPAVTACTFVRCSIAFVRQADMVPDMLGRGQIASFVAPYHCPDCGHEDEKVMQTTAFAPGDPDPEFPCPKCGHLLVFDEVRERYLAFRER